METLTRSREEYQTKEYQASGLPAAPAVMVEDEIAAQGRGISEARVNAVIRRHLGLPELPPEPGKGLLERLFKQ